MPNNVLYSIILVGVVFLIVTITLCIYGYYNYKDKKATYDTIPYDIIEFHHRMYLLVSTHTFQQRYNQAVFQQCKEYTPISDGNQTYYVGIQVKFEKEELKEIEVHPTMSLYQTRIYTLYTKEEYQRILKEK